MSPLAGIPIVPSSTVTKVNQTTYPLDSSDWNPAFDGPGTTFCMDPSRGFNMWKEYKDSGNSVQTHPVVFGVDPVGTLVDSASGIWIACTSNGPKLAKNSDGFPCLKFDGTNVMQAWNTKTQFCDLWSVVKYTDLAIGGGTGGSSSGPENVINSSGSPFTLKDVGHSVTLTAGTGFNVTTAKITSVNATTGDATLDNQAGVAGSTGGTGRKGFIFTVLIQCAPQNDGATMTLIDNSGSNNIGSGYGFYIFRHSSNVVEARISHIATANTVNLDSGNTILNDGLEHIIKLTCDGTTATLTADNGTPVTGAMSTTGANAATDDTACPNELFIGCDAANGNKYTGTISKILIANTNWDDANWNDNSQNITRWRNYNPPYTLSNEKQRVGLNGRFAVSADFLALLGGTSLGNPGVLAHNLKTCMMCNDLTDANTIYTAVTGSGQDLRNSGSLVATQGDTVSFIRGKTPAVWRRDLSASATQPIWDTGTNGSPVPCVFFNNTTDAGGAATNWLNFPLQIPGGYAKSFIIAFQNLRAGTNQADGAGPNSASNGSHPIAMSTGGGGTKYLAMGGSQHVSVANRNAATWHCGGSGTPPTGPKGIVNEGWHIIEGIQTGQQQKILMDGLFVVAGSSAGLQNGAIAFLPTWLGKSEKVGWSMNGYIAYMAWFHGEVDRETFRRMRVGIVNLLPTIPWPSNMNLSY